MDWMQMLMFAGRTLVEFYKYVNSPPTLEEAFFKEIQTGSKRSKAFLKKVKESMNRPPGSPASPSTKRGGKRGGVSKKKKKSTTSRGSRVSVPSPSNQSVADGQRQEKDQKRRQKRQARMKRKAALKENDIDLEDGSQIVDYDEDQILWEDSHRMDHQPSAGLYHYSVAVPEEGEAGSMDQVMTNREDESSTTSNGNDSSSSSSSSSNGSDDKLRRLEDELRQLREELSRFNNPALAQSTHGDNNNSSSSSFSSNNTNTHHGISTVTNGVNFAAGTMAGVPTSLVGSMGFTQLGSFMTPVCTAELPYLKQIPLPNLDSDTEEDQHRQRRKSSSSSSSSAMDDHDDDESAFQSTTTTTISSSSSFSVPPPVMAGGAPPPPPPLPPANGFAIKRKLTSSAVSTPNNKKAAQVSKLNAQCFLSGSDYIWGIESCVFHYRSIVRNRSACHTQGSYT